MRAHESRHAVERGQNDFLSSVYPPGCIASTCGLELPDGLTDDQWAEIGRVIIGIRSATRWWLGDWWAGGEHRYGDRGALVASDAWDGPGLQACMDAASVARAFTTSRRREVLSFGHHREVASLPPDQADAFLDWAEESAANGDRPRSIRALRAERDRRSQRSLSPTTEAMGVAEYVSSPQSSVDPPVVRVVAQVVRAMPADLQVKSVVTASPQRVIPSAIGVATWPTVSAGGSDPQNNRRPAADFQLSALLLQLGTLASMDTQAVSATIGQPQRAAYIDIALRARQQIDLLIQSLRE